MVRATVGRDDRRASRRGLYRQGKRLLAQLLARRWNGPRGELEPALRRFLAGRTRGYLARLVGDRAFAVGAALSLLAACTASALPVDLSDVSAGNGGFVLNGSEPFDFSGRSVAGAGDVNGDGLDDVIVGAFRANPAGDIYAGESYVVFGKADGTAVNLSDAANGIGGFVITGIDPQDYSGFCVSGAGDVNGDGLGDVIVGAFGADPGGTIGEGESYVVFGKADGTAVDLSDVAHGTGGFIMLGFDPQGYSGRSVSGAGDVNGDGLNDVIVGAFDPAGFTSAGKSYVVFGKADGERVLLLDVAQGFGGFIINGIDLNDFSGCSVSSAGDVNGDGLDDVIVGAFGADPAGNAFAGESYVVFGKASGTPVNLSGVVAGTGGFVINGIDPDDRSGYSVSGAGDVNGDGLDDVIVGARYADPTGTNDAGESYVVFGKADGTPVNLADVAADTGGFIINGIDPYDRSGYSVSGAGDVNGDGLDDLAVGAFGADPAGNSYAGESYVVFSPACPWDCDGSDDGIVSVTDLLALLAQYDPTSPKGCTGGSCDFNNDGCVDVVDLLKFLAHYDPAGAGCP